MFRLKVYDLGFLDGFQRRLLGVADLKFGGEVITKDGVVAVDEGGRCVCTDGDTGGGCLEDYGVTIGVGCITIYPKGIMVSDHLSLFLCVANHDKLLRGWSHFAQFTIAVVNKDPNKSKYSDTLHRFWEKEHDWGWKKFMELSRLSDGFLDDGTLKIKAQVQVIRDRSDCPFPCLDNLYRRELLRVYSSNLETICRLFVEDKRGKFGQLIEDKVKWSSFCSGIDQNSRDHMLRVKSDSILPQVVKYFFIEKEVTSTLLMESLYIGLTALKETSMPIVRMEKGSFILVDDLLLLLERVATEPLTQKDGQSGEFSIEREAMEPLALKDDHLDEFSIESEEKHLAELGRRTIEIYVVAHILSKTEVAYEEAALKLQEEVIHKQD
ncbi:hypothetical protein R6Q57_025031 [Mikania cordata]